MPILDLEYTCSNGKSIPQNAVQRIADFAAKVFGSGPGQTWVKARSLEKGSYAENGIAPNDLPAPVFVTVLKRKIGSEEELAGEANELAEGIGFILNTAKENVHVKFEEGLGRVAFGGKLLQSKPPADARDAPQIYRQSG